MFICKNCIHDKICAKRNATGGNVRKCENFMKDNNNYCHMCYNARLDNELTDDNDYSSCTVGSYDKDCRIMVSSGWGKPLRIEIDRWNDMAEHWETIGIYYPKFCPNCGREIVEYNK